MCTINKTKVMPKEKKAIVTLAIGDFYEKMGSITHPLMKKYANNVGADFVCISQPDVADITALPPKYEKFQIYDLFDRYDRILFIDTDIIVNPDAPDIFDYCPAECFGAVSEESYSGSTLEKKVTQEILGSVDWIYPYINSGVMVIPKTCREIFNYRRPELKRWAIGDFRKKYPTVLNDQPYISHYINLKKYSFYELGVKFNHTRAYPDSHKRFQSFFIHYSGHSGHRYGDRLTQIHLDAGVMKNTVNKKISAMFPFYRWLVDRFNIDFLKYLFCKFSGNN